MKSLLLGITATLADIAAFASPLPMQHSTQALFALLLAHGTACAIAAFAAYLALPGNHREPRWQSWLLLFSFSFICPVIGPLGLLFVIRTSLRPEAETLEYAKPVSIDLPEFDIYSKEASRSGQGAIRSRLSSSVPDGIRMQSLLTLRAVPARVSNPILEELLGDATDDVRLIAFGMLDSEEKKISDRIHEERKNLQRELTPAQRYVCLRHLAELHWELVYTSLASGELGKHILGEARQHLEAALALGEKPDSGIMFLKGRILLAQGDLGLAEESLINAVSLGHPAVSVLPYLSEIAFQRREFGVVKRFMDYFSERQHDSRLKGIADLWTGRESVRSFMDRRILPHI